MSYLDIMKQVFFTDEFPVWVSWLFFFIGIIGGSM